MLDELDYSNDETYCYYNGDIYEDANSPCRLISIETIKFQDEINNLEFVQYILNNESYEWYLPKSIINNNMLLKENVDRTIVFSPIFGKRILLTPMGLYESFIYANSGNYYYKIKLVFFDKSMLTQSILFTFPDIGDYNEIFDLIMNDLIVKKHISIFE